jgi:tRNA G18 (ribose-2'-O)-methylase SpoU
MNSFNFKHHKNSSYSFLVAVHCWIAISFRNFRVWVLLLFFCHAMQSFHWVRSLCLNRRVMPRQHMKRYRGFTSSPYTTCVQRPHTDEPRGCYRLKSTGASLYQTQGVESNVGEEDDDNIINKSSENAKNQRMQLLHDQLLQFTAIDPVELGRAVEHALTNPAVGYYHEDYGSSALKAYRSYVYPKKHQRDESWQHPVVAAARTARQIEFLIKRHKSHQLEWVRHHDTSEMDSTAYIDSETDQSQNLEKRNRTFPVILLLDNLRSANNVGSIFRTADACGCTEVITTGITPHPRGSGCQKISKTSLGADTLVPTRHFHTTQQAIQSLRADVNNSIFIVGLETTYRSLDFTQVEYPKFFSMDNGTSSGVLVVVFGNEVTGIDTEVMPFFDMLIQIPMFGRKNSLNVAACAPVVLYEVLRQWGVMEKQQYPHG